MPSEPRIEIVESTTGDQVAKVANLMRDFVAWCRWRYRDRPELVNTYFEPKAWNDELARLADKYRAPDGAMLLAMVDGEPRQRVLPLDGPLPRLERIDLSASPDGEAALREAYAHAARRLDIAAAPPLGFQLLRLEPTRHVLIAAIHEAIGRKPKGHDFIIDRRQNRPAVGRHMSVTGG